MSIEHLIVGATAMTDRELMQDALYALESFQEISDFTPASAVHSITALRERLAQPVHDWEAEYTKQVELHNQTLDELRDALALPEQEPVAYIHRQGNHWEVAERFLCDDEKARGWTEEPLYTAPPRCSNCASLEAQNTELDAKLAELEAENVKFKEANIVLMGRLERYQRTHIEGWENPTPQPRQWVGLTEEEMVDLQDRCGISIHQSDFEAIEAKLREKNGGEA